jgi:curli production assembly/transport component CsgF
MAFALRAPWLAGRWWCFALVVAAWMVAAGAAHAASLTYQPIDPSFGGNPLNSAHLLGVANAQNNYSAPAPPASAADYIASQFASQLQSRLLSALADDITKAIFGDNPQQSGTIVFGDQTVTFSRGLDTVELDINNTATGQDTKISVPLLVNGP